MIGRLVGVIIGRFGSNLEQLAGKRQAGVADRARQQAMVANSMEPARQNVEQEAPDELVGTDSHDPLTLGAVVLIVLVAEDDAGLVERDQPPIGDGRPVLVA